MLFIRDEDPERRRLAARNAAALLERSRDVETGSLDCGPFAVVWGAYPGAPLEHAPDEGRVALLAGDARRAGDSQRLRAPALTRDSMRRGIPDAMDGYHLAALVETGGSLTLAVDVLGLYPVYHTSAGGVLLVATLPQLLRAHPAFVPALDPLGLTGLLVTNGFVGGATLHRGVRRLAPGHVLSASPGAEAKEVEHYALPSSHACHGLPFEECAHILHDALVEACRRQVPADTPHTLLLSGGQDARLLAGALAALQVPMTALTRGEAADLDYRCARAAARHLGIPQRLVPHDADPGGLERAIARHGLCASPDTGGTEALAAELHRLHPRVVSGHVMDEAVAGSHLGLCYDPESRRLGFERFFERLNGWSIPVALLRRLLRQEVFGESLDEVTARVRDAYEAAGETDLERTYRFDMRHRERFHVGQAFARLASGAWPCSPCLDRGLLEVVGGLPMDMLAGRRLQHEILRRHYPKLAGLPLDHKSLVTTPLEPRVRDLLESAARKQARRIAARFGVRPRERRYYYRGFNFNGAHWRTIRRAAEPARELAYALFDRGTFDALVPPADGPWSDTHAPTGSAGVKLLTTLGMWLRQEQADPRWAPPGAAAQT